MGGVSNKNVFVLELGFLGEIGTVSLTKFGTYILINAMVTY